MHGTVPCITSRHLSLSQQPYLPETSMNPSTALCRAHGFVGRITELPGA